MGRTGVWLCVAALGLPGGAQCQHPSAPVAVDEWIRFSTKGLDDPAEWVVGAVAFFTNDQLVISPIGNHYLAVAWKAITQLQVRRGLESKAGLNPWVRRAIGIALGVGWGLAFRCHPYCLLATVPTTLVMERVFGPTATPLHWHPVDTTALRRSAPVLMFELPISLPN